jgi:hypothetical protein
MDIAAVSIQVTRTGKSDSTDFAHKRFLATVNSKVSCQRTRTGKRLATRLANERSLARMSPSMLCHIASARDNLPTVRTSCATIALI